MRVNIVLLDDVTATLSITEVAGKLKNENDETEAVVSTDIQSRGKFK